MRKLLLGLLLLLVILQITLWFGGGGLLLAFGIARPQHGREASADHSEPR